MWSTSSGRPGRPGRTHRPLVGATTLAGHRARAARRESAPPRPAPPVAHRRALLLPIRGAVALAALALVVLAAPWGEAHAERAATVEVAMVTDLAGRVERQPHTIEAWSAVALDEGVRLFDGMRTWARSTAELRFVDGTVVMLDEKTRLRISPVLFDPAEAPEEVRLALAAGAAEVRAGERRLYVATPDGAQHVVEPGGSLRVAVGDDPRAPRVGPPTSPMPIDLERGTAPTPAGSGSDGAGTGPASGGRGDGTGGIFDPTAGPVDPASPVEAVVEALPDGVGAAVDVGGEGVIVLPPLAGMPGDGEMPGPEMPGPETPGPELPGVPDLPDLTPGGDILGDLPGGLLPVLDLPVPTEGRVRVSVEVRRR